MAFSRMKQAFVRKTEVIINELQPRLAGNVAGTENAFKLRIGALIRDMNAELVSEIRTNKEGKRFEFVQVKFKDGAMSKLPTPRILHRPVERNEYAAEIQSVMQQAAQ